MLVEALAGACGEDNILCDSRISRVMHDGHRIQSIEINGSERFDVNWVVSTLPLTILLRIMDPQPEQAMLDLANSLRFRDVMVAALFLNRDGINDNGSIYFPDPDYPFTRGYEPRNRSPHMAPPGKTSFCIELPCYRSDPLWYASDQEIVDIVIQQLQPTGWIKPEEIIGSKIVRLPNAYPVLELGFEEKIETMMRYLDRFENLRLSGRSGKFVYTHVHDMMRFGIDIIDELNAADGHSTPGSS